MQILLLEKPQNTLTDVYFSRNCRVSEFIVIEIKGIIISVTVFVSILIRGNDT